MQTSREIPKLAQPKLPELLVELSLHDGEMVR